MPNFSLFLDTLKRSASLAGLVAVLACSGVLAAEQPASAPAAPIVLHAARLLQVETGTLLQPGEILVVGDHIRAVGTTVSHPQGANVIDLGDTTLLPGLLDAHVQYCSGQSHPFRGGMKVIDWRHEPVSHFFSKRSSSTQFC
jgi:predicted amidohydrolase YtcJ